MMLAIHPNAKFIEFDDSVQIVTALESITLEGGKSIVRELRELIPVTASLGQLLAGLAGSFDSTEQCSSFIDFMRARYILVDSLIDSATRYESTLDMLARGTDKYNRIGNADEYVDRGERALVPIKSIVISEHSHFRAELSELMKPYGFSFTRELEDQSTLQVHIGVDQSAADIAAVNDTLFTGGIPFMLANLDGSRLQLGPLVVPGSTACYRCSVRRTHSNARHKSESAAALTSPVLLSNQSTQQVDPILKGVLINLLANELLKIRVNSSKYCLVDRYLSFDVISNDLEFVPILKVARCHTCSALHDKPLHALRDLM